MALSRQSFTRHSGLIDMNIIPDYYEPSWVVDVEPTEENQEQYVGEFQETVEENEEESNEEYLEDIEEEEDDD